MTITPEQLVQREVLCCVSTLVSTLAEGATAPESHNADGTVLADLAWQAFHLASPIPDYEEAAIRAEVTFYPAASIPGYWHYRDPSGVVSGSAYPTRQEAAHVWCDYHGIEPYDRKVYEHWAVTDRLADKLEARGERVARDFAGLTVWARTTTGQMIAADGVIEAITAELNIGGEG